MKNLEQYWERERTKMSDVLWCDSDDPKTNQYELIPGHTFPEKDADRQRFTQTRQIQVKTGNSYGRATYQDREEITVVIDMCGYHWAKQNPFQHKEPIEIEAQTQVEKNEDYNQGWRDAEAHFS